MTDDLEAVLVDVDGPAPAGPSPSVSELKAAAGEFERLTGSLPTVKQCARFARRQGPATPVVLSPAARQLLGRLLDPRTDSDDIVARDEVWEEARRAFPPA